ncbi:DUF3040 domain-containing protein [Okibacterium endophyticum]
MPLSEQEQRLLDEMERNLYRNDADVVSTSGDHRGRPTYRSIALGSVITIAGIAALVAGVIMQLAVVGIVGFAIMLAGVMVAITPTRVASDHEPSAEDRLHAAKAGGSKRNVNLMDRLNDRWDKRQDER